MTDTRPNDGLEDRASIAIPRSPLRPKAAVAIFVQGEHRGAQTSVIAVTCGAAAANCAELSRRPSESGPHPYGSIPILQERVNSEPAERQDAPSVDRSSNSPVRRGCRSRGFRRGRQEGSDLGSPKLLPRRQGQRHRSNSVEAKQTGLGAQPEITVGRLGDCVDRPM